MTFGLWVKLPPINDELISSFISDKFLSEKLLATPRDEMNIVDIVSEIAEMHLMFNLPDDQYPDHIDFVGETEDGWEVLFEIREAP